MSMDSEYHVSSHDWPAGTGADDLTLDQANEVFDLFDTYYSIAVQGLSTVPITLPTASQFSSGTTMRPTDGS